MVVVVVVVCVVCVVCVVWCGVVSGCACVGGVVLWKKKTCVRSKRHPCVSAPRAHVETHARGASRHGDVLNLHTEGVLYIHTEGVRGEEGGCRRQFCLPKFAHVGLSRGAKRGSPKKQQNLTHFQFKNRSRTTHCRVLQSFALLDEAVQFQQS